MGKLDDATRDRLKLAGTSFAPSIQTNITNVSDSQAGTAAYLDGIPDTGSTIITNRTFTPNTNCKFTKIPHVSFEKTDNPDNYSYSVIKNQNGSYSFTVNYFRPTTPLPTNDIIEFFAIAKTNADVSGLKVYSWNMDITNIKDHGEKRTLRIVGDAGAKLKIAVTQNPRDGLESLAKIVVEEYVATIGENGIYERIIKFPPMPTDSKATSYRVILSENTSGTFSAGLSQSPTTIFLNQWPLQVTRLQIIETDDTTWVLPSPGAGSDVFYYSARRGAKTVSASFSFTCTHSANISAGDTFKGLSFTQVTGQSNTLHPTFFPEIPTKVIYKNLFYTIDNTVSPKTVTISGKVDIKHGYDGNGHTLITLNINDILNHA